MNEHTEDWAKVQAALANPAWDFRTVDGITRDTSLPRERVERVLRRNRSMVRRAVSRDRRAVYTLKSRPKKLREFFADVLTFASR